MFISADLARGRYNPAELGIDISDSQSIITVSQRPPGPPLSQSLASLISRSHIFACSYAAVNTALGGGLPKGHILEISGPPGSFKETLALDYARIFVEANEEVIFIGTVYFTFDVSIHLSEKLGIDTQNMTSLATIKKTFHSTQHVTHFRWGEQQE